MREPLDDGRPSRTLPLCALGIVLFAALGCGGEAGRDASRPNVILISVDTLRADHLSLYGYPRSTSPRIDAWARNSAAGFRNAVVQAPWTLPSHCSMLTGLDALSHGVNHSFEAVPGELTTVAERLSEAGYFTAGITGGGWFHPRYGLAAGYDRYRYWSGKRRGDEELEAHAPIASGWLDELPEPFFHDRRRRPHRDPHHGGTMRDEQVRSSNRRARVLSASARGCSGAGSPPGSR